MTDTAPDNAVIAPIDAIAHTAVTEPDTLTTADKVRLGAWIIDHHAHIAAHYETLAEAGGKVGQPVPDMGVAVRKSELIDRLAPKPQIAGSTVETTESGT